MAKFDVYAGPDGGYLLDCQADVLRNLNTRFVVPLGPQAEHAGADALLNPVFVADGQRLVMLTHLAAAIPANLLRTAMTSLEAHEYEIGRALDMLIGGF